MALFQTDWLALTCCRQGLLRDRVKIVQDALEKSYKDREFLQAYEKLVGESPDPIMPEAMAKVIKETHAILEVIETLKKFSGAGPLPPR